MYRRSGGCGELIGVAALELERKRLWAVGGVQIVASGEELSTAPGIIWGGKVLLRCLQCVCEVKAQCAGVRLQLRAPKCQDQALYTKLGTT
jgi:hypothetical protein